MNNRRIFTSSSGVLAVLLSCVISTATAQSQDPILVDSSIIDRAMNVLGQKYSESAETQQEITRLASSASSNFEAFQRANDALESLLVLNAGYRRSISIQEQNIATLDESIAAVQEVTREIPLLMEKMLSSIEQFIELDYPFHQEERRARIQIARDAIDNPDVSIAEKFRQVLVIYQTEAFYGRTFETYDETIDIGGVDRDVTVARVGRVALVYQTKDRQVTGAWNNNSRAWEELPVGEYRSDIQRAIRIVSQLDAPGVINLPVLPPESVQ